MPDVQEVFRMSTQKVKPDPGALERQFGQQRRRTIRRKAGVYGLVAALVVIAAVAVREGVVSARHVPAGQPSHQTVPGAAPVGTVTFDGAKCWFQRSTVDPIQSGALAFEAVNSSGERVMFDSWTISKGYTFREFSATIREDAWDAAHGRPGHGFPSDKEVTYLGSDIVPANTTQMIGTLMGKGDQAIACLKPYDGGGPRERFRPAGLAGPIHVR
jgi:hypothetical protein